MNTFTCIAFGIIVFIVVVKILNVVTKGRCTSKAKLNGKTVLITGASGGIGKETAIDMAARGARVILGCRNLKFAEDTKQEIISKTGNTNIVIYQIDFESLTSVRKFSKLIHENESRLDVLINNAGAMGLGNKITEDGLHIMMQVNHFGPFLLTNLLLDLLKKSAPSRIVTVSSLGYILTLLDPDNLNKPRRFDELNYFNSKLCNILMSNELARKLEGTNVTSNCLHPGVIYTPLFKHLPWYKRIPVSLIFPFLFKNTKEGAQTTIHCAVCEKVYGVSGKYFQDCKEYWTLPIASNRELDVKVWNKSMEFVKLQENEIHY
ncbi:retinol dehydrogenase 12-like isoform X1 [Chrysoperla carnea]|uniref:retinol dehydrogenase 12-like isoform X1 n=1 Tax=Chrysoperla carnea TaxID=189513 RepID=UPI001D092B2F|nr:retinol dehydrogenase 12-like isoform X1 [Chrysoperla carnea]